MSAAKQKFTIPGPEDLKELREKLPDQRKKNVKDLENTELVIESILEDIKKEKKLEDGIKKLKEEFLREKELLIELLEKTSKPADDIELQKLQIEINDFIDAVNGLKREYEKFVKAANFEIADEVVPETPPHPVKSKAGPKSEPEKFGRPARIKEDVKPTIVDTTVKPAVEIETEAEKVLRKFPTTEGEIDAYLDSIIEAVEKSKTGSKSKEALEYIVKDFNAINDELKLKVGNWFNDAMENFRRDGFESDKEFKFVLGKFLKKFLEKPADTEKRKPKERAVKEQSKKEPFKNEFNISRITRILDGLIDPNANKVKDVFKKEIRQSTRFVDWLGLDIIEKNLINIVDSFSIDTSKENWIGAVLNQFNELVEPLYDLYLNNKEPHLAALATEPVAPSSEPEKAEDVKKDVFPERVINRPPGVPSSVEQPVPSEVEKKKETAAFIEPNIKMINDQLEFLLRFKEINPTGFNERLKIFDKYSKGAEGLSEEELEDRETIYKDWSDEHFDELISLVEKELNIQAIQKGEMKPEAGLVEELDLAELIKDEELNRLRTDLDKKRKQYIKAKKAYEKKDKLTAKISRIFSRKKIADIETNFAEAEVAYKEARAEYVGVDIDRMLEEQINVVEAEIEEQEEPTKLEKGWSKLRLVYKKLGDLNIGEKTEFGRKQMEKSTWLGKVFFKMLSVRTATFAGMAAASTITSGVSLVLAGGLRFVGSSGLSYDFMENLAKARKERKGMLKEMTEQEISELNDEEISKRLRAIEGIVILDGVKMTESKYFENYKRLQAAFKKRLQGGFAGEEVFDEQDRVLSLDGSMKKVDFELEDELKKLRSGRTKRKVVAGAIGVAASAGLIGKLIGKAGSETAGAFKNIFGYSPEEHHVDYAMPLPEEIPKPAVESVVEEIHEIKLSPEEFKAQFADSLVHKGEGITHVLQRDLHANPDHIDAYKHNPGVAKIIDAHNGNFDEISGKELNRAAWLIENDKVKGFGQEVLIKGPDDNVVVIFNEQNQRYEMGTLDNSDIGSRIYSKLDVSVETTPTVIENVGGAGTEVAIPQAPDELGGNEIKNFYPTDKGFNVIMPDGTTYEGYQWSAINPRGGEIGNIDSLMNGDAVLVAGENAGYVGGAPETAGSTLDVVGGFETTQKSINVPFAGKLPEGSVIRTDELLKMFGDKQGIEASLAETAPPHFEGEMDKTPPVWTETVETAVTPEVQANYMGVFQNVRDNYIDYLDSKVEYIGLDGSAEGATNSANLGALIALDLESSALLDSTNTELVDMFSPDSTVSSDQLSEAVSNNMFEHITPAYANEAQLLLNTSVAGEFETDVIEGGSNMLKLSTGGKDYVLFDEQYNFHRGAQGDLVATNIESGRDYTVDIDESRKPPIVSLK